MTGHEWNDVRWQCPKCARFVAQSTVDSENVYDPIDSYYGFFSRTFADCKKCGRVEDPRLVPVKTYVYVEV